MLPSLCDGRKRADFSLGPLASQSSPVLGIATHLALIPTPKSDPCRPRPQGSLPSTRFARKYDEPSHCRFDLSTCNYIVNPVAIGVYARVMHYRLAVFHYH